MNIQRLTYDEVFEIVLNDVYQIMNSLSFGNDTINSIITEQLIELEIKNKTTFTKELMLCILKDSEKDIRFWYDHFKPYLMQGQFKKIQNQQIYKNMKSTLIGILETSYLNC